MDRLVIAGTSLAGCGAARGLRAAGFDGTVTLVGQEREQPYDKPPLSKQFLAGTVTLDDIRLELPDDVDLRLGVHLTGLDPARHVLLHEGGEVPYDGVIIATGARPRTLSGFELPGVQLLRTLADGMALRERLDIDRPRVVIVGSGFIGAEIASACRDRDVDVTIVEADPQPFARTFGDVAAAQLARLHTDRGVRLVAGTPAVRAVGEGRVEGVELGDGQVLPADIVVVAVGVQPNTEWLAGSGLETDDGLIADASLLVAPGIVAAGDVVRWPHPLFGRIRIEHWDNAVQQGEHAARRLLGVTTEPYAEVPWVWSDQHGLKIQSLGLTTDHDEALVVGDLADNPKRPRVLVLYRRGDRLTGMMGVRQAKELMRLRELAGRPGSWAAAVAPHQDAAQA